MPPAPTAKESITQEQLEQAMKEYEAQLERPAPIQVTKEQLESKRVDLSGEAYEGLYNIWHYKRPGLDKETEDIVKNVFRCEPSEHVGATRADLAPPPMRFCLFFARGCCSKGSECEYLHRIPDKAHQAHIEESHDAFGRPRFGWRGAELTTEVRTIRIDNLPSNRPELANRLKYYTGMYGEVAEFSYIPSMNVCFVEYRCRAQAEFAKEALTGNNVGDDECLHVKWYVSTGKHVAVHERNAVQELQDDIAEAKARAG